MNETPNHKTQNQKIVKPVKSGIRAWHLSVIIIILLAISATVWWWQQQNVNSLSSKVNDLNGQVATLIAEKELQPTPSESVVTTYTAQVGKFSLTVEENYGIVVIHDGGAEGSPLTKLLVAEKTATPGVIKSDMYAKAELTAVKHGLYNTTFAQAVSRSLEHSTFTKLPSIVIGGVTAEVYKIEGLDYAKKIFFAKDEMLYIIDLTFMNEKTDKMLEAIVKGFIFE